MTFKGTAKCWCLVCLTSMMMLMTVETAPCAAKSPSLRVKVPGGLLVTLHKEMNRVRRQTST